MFLSRIFVGYFNSPVFNHCVKFSAVELKAIYLDVSFLHNSLYAFCPVSFSHLAIITVQ